jgi:hypothetical protein
VEARSQFTGIYLLDWKKKRKFNQKGWYELAITFNLTRGLYFMWNKKPVPQL